jgi:hypothetical protein
MPELLFLRRLCQIVVQTGFLLVHPPTGVIAARQCRVRVRVSATVPCVCYTYNNLGPERLSNLITM